MNRRELMLAALAANEPGALYEPVQVQKLFFLIDREIAALVSGPHFDFCPYDYGPFDSAVYTELESMKRDGLVAVVAGYYRRYALTQDGLQRGTALLTGMSAPARDFIERSAIWVRSVSFSQLVSAIYQKYPDMKAASVFRDA